MTTVQPTMKKELASMADQAYDDKLTCLWDLEYAIAIEFCVAELMTEGTDHDDQTMDKFYTFANPQDADAALELLSPLDHVVSPARYAKVEGDPNSVWISVSDLYCVLRFLEYRNKHTYRDYDHRLAKAQDHVGHKKHGMLLYNFSA